jgi:hypothetical protein
MYMGFWYGKQTLVEQSRRREDNTAIHFRVTLCLEDRRMELAQSEL